MQNIDQILKINEIMDSFGFNATWQIFNLFNIKWKLPNGQVAAPDEKLIRITIRNAFNSLCEEPIPEDSKNEWSLTSNRGPYQLRRFGGEKDGIAWEELSLAFVAESYQTGQTLEDLGLQGK
jgi:hypothetical protein